MGLLLGDKEGKRAQIRRTLFPSMLMQAGWCSALGVCAPLALVGRAPSLCLLLSAITIGGPGKAR